MTHLHRFMRRHGLRVTERGEYVAVLTAAAGVALGLYGLYCLLAWALGVQDVPG